MLNLKLTDFKSYQVKNSNQIKGGTSPTAGGTHHVLMQSFDFGRDVQDGNTIAYCDITNSTYGPDSCGGPKCGCS